MIRGWRPRFYLVVVKSIAKSFSKLLFMEDGILRMQTGKIQINRETIGCRVMISAMYTPSKINDYKSYCQKFLAHARIISRDVMAVELQLDHCYVDKLFTVFNKKIDMRYLSITMHNRGLNCSDSYTDDIVALIRQYSYAESWHNYNIECDENTKKLSNLKKSSKRIPAIQYNKIADVCSYKERYLQHRRAYLMKLERDEIRLRYSRENRRKKRGVLRNAMNYHIQISR